MRKLTITIAAALPPAFLEKAKKHLTEIYKEFDYSERSRPTWASNSSKLQMTLPAQGYITRAMSDDKKIKAREALARVERDITMSVKFRCDKEFPFEDFTIKVNKEAIVVTLKLSGLKAVHKQEKVEMKEAVSDVSGRTKKIIKQFMILQKKFNGFETGDVYFDADLSNNNRKISIYYSYTFRRDTHLGAYQRYSGKFARCNAYLQEIADSFKGSKLVTVQLFLADANRAKKRDMNTDENGDSQDGYSEYEQSFGGALHLTLKG
jgi:hypothetical protein